MEQETGQGTPTEVKVKIVRTRNPLIEPLSRKDDHLARFDEVINTALGKLTLGTRAKTLLEPNKDLQSRDNPDGDYPLTSFRYQDLDDRKIRSLEVLTKSMRPRQKAAKGLYFDLNPSQGGLKHLFRRTAAPRIAYYFGSTIYDSLKGNPSRRDGIFLTGNKQWPVAGSWKVQAEKMLTAPPKNGTFEYHNTGSMGETEAAYLIAVGAMITEGKLDLSTKEAIEASLPTQRKIFIDIYQQMLKDILPIPGKNDVFDLDDQLADIQTNLYRPLETKTGNPMNTLMVGAPGVGKSLAGRYFAGNENLLTVPVSIDEFGQEGNLENYVLPRLINIRDRLDLPIILLVDDVEGLFEKSISKDNSRDGQSQSVDVNERSRNLTLLERMTDTYGIYLLCTLNHPDVESAFLRRFNPVYFPLPTDDQRREFLDQTVPFGPLDQEGAEAIKTELAVNTQGFNYNAIALIPRYLQNQLLLNPQAKEDSLLYVQAVRVAVSKARETSDVKGLAIFDEAARTMISKQKKSLGFIVTSK